MTDYSTSTIDFDHKCNLHSVSGAWAALHKLFAGLPPTSVLDIGCGTGTWLRAALDLGVSEVYGIDGVPIEPDELLVPQQFFQVEDLTRRIDLGRKFDIVLCLELAEHLPADAAPTLIDTLVTHSDLILFSAAAPYQQGQHHINCQWPSYWQDLFNMQGYVCDDSFRWQLWEIQAVEPWYRQNIFVARRASVIAGQEPRINSVIHPDMLRIKAFEVFERIEREVERRSVNKCIDEIETGSKSLSWYISLFSKTIATKVGRRLPRL